MKYNEFNQQIWDNEMSKQPPVSDEDCCCVCCDDGNGNYQPAVPMGYEPEMKEYSAVKDIIEGAIKNKTYKTWKVGSALVETYSDEHEELRIFDVVYLFSSDWEVPIMPVLIIGNNEKDSVFNVAYIDDNKDDVVKRTIYYGE
jgi:hypothetical protein